METKQQNPHPRVGLKPLNTCFFLVFPKVFTKPNKPSGKPNNTVFKGFRPTLGYVFFFIFFLFFFGFPEGFYKTKKTFEKTKNTKENQKNLRENKQNTVFKGFRPTLGYLFFVFFFWFSREFLENQNNIMETKQQNPHPRVGLKPLNTCFFLVFPNFFLVFFGIFGFPCFFFF